MFSHLVTAAKGFLKRQDTEGDSSDTILDNNPKMARVTRRSSAAEKAESESTVIANGSGESQPSSAGKKGGKNNKRRRSGTQDNGVPDESQDRILGSEAAQKESAGKGGHIRFGSEEPELPEEVEAEEASETGSQHQDEEEEDSDDDAPETVDNSAQLSKIKEQAQKREQARQREENLKKEKRKQLDEQRKLQAQLANKKKEVVGADDESESSATLQGSTTQDGRRSGLPAFLPDDILNAAPSTRPPTPPVDDVAPVQKPNKLKFLDKVEKRPKDVRMDGATIRVLDDGPSRKKAKTTLPPKSSKSGRNARDNWLKNSRSTAQVNGLRRTGGGVSSFVRK